MWGGGAFKAAFHAATDAAKKSVAAIATGAEKVGPAALHGIDVAKNKVVDAVKWTAKETKAATQWIAEKGQQAVDLGKKAAKAPGNALNAAKKKFTDKLKSGVAALKCNVMEALSNTFAPMVRRLPPPLTRSEAKARLENHQEALEKAKLANDVYNARSQLSNDSKYERISKDKLPSGLQNATWNDPKSGFGAALYKTKDSPSKYIVAFQGTEMKSGADWKNNFQQAIGAGSRQYQQAVDLAESVGDVYGNNVEFTGHSLGGGLASAASLATGRPATVFNAARLSDKTMQKLGSNPIEAKKLVENYYVEGEILTGVQDHAGEIAGSIAGGAGEALEGIAGGAFGQMLGGTIGTKVGKNFGDTQLGNPVGRQLTIPAVDKSGNELTLRQADAVERHGMDYVLNGMDKQIQIDQSQMESLPAE
jgi:hypothetical protein